MVRLVFTETRTTGFPVRPRASQAQWLCDTSVSLEWNELCYQLHQRQVVIKILIFWWVAAQKSKMLSLLILIHLSCSNSLHEPRIIPQRNAKDKFSQAVSWARGPTNAAFLQIWVLCFLNSASHPIIVALVHVPLKCPVGIDSTRCSYCAAIHRLASWPGYRKFLYSAYFCLMGVIKLGSLPSMQLSIFQ